MIVFFDILDVLYHYSYLLLIYLFKSSSKIFVRELEQAQDVEKNKWLKYVTREQKDFTSIANPVLRSQPKHVSLK